MFIVFVEFVVLLTADSVPLLTAYTLSLHSDPGILGSLNPLIRSTLLNNISPSWLRLLPESHGISEIIDMAR